LKIRFSNLFGVLVGVFEANTPLYVIALLWRGQFVDGRRIGGQKDPQGGGEETEGAGGVENPGPACGGGDQAGAGHRHHGAKRLTFNSELL